MYEGRLGSEQVAILETVRDFVAQEVKPVALSPDRLQADDQHLPEEIAAKASEIGLRTLALSEALGGIGANNFTSCIVGEELAVGDVGLAITLAQTSTLGHILFDQVMTPEQRDRFLSEFLEDHHYHLAYAGNDLDSALGGWNYYRAQSSELNVPVTAQRQANGDWLLNGVYPFVANAPLAKLFAVQVRIQSGSNDSSERGVLIVPRGTPGISVREIGRICGTADGDQTCRWFHGRGGELVFSDCRVAADNLLATPSNGGLVGASEAGYGSPLIQALNVGVGRAAYEPAIEYAKIRVQGGRPIIEHQAIGKIISEIAIRIEVARNMVWKAAWASDRQDDHASAAELPLQAIAKVFVSEAMYQVTLLAAECFGAMGVMRDMPMQKYVHDALVFLTGTSNSTVKLRIAEVVADYRRS
jgi:alkylation response protein AidB-like acyl-CoA dehydrogenase